MDHDVTIVIMTRDRVGELCRTLPHLLELPGPPPIVLVDNASSDGTVEQVRDRFPAVEVIALEHNAGVKARTIGAERATTRYVAFNDDDSWWSARGLWRVVETFDAHPAIGAITGHVVVEPAGTDDPVTVVMATSPVEGVPGLPGIPVLGFLACATAVRRDAYLAVGGFHEGLHFGGEEQLLAVDLAAAGWELRYLPDAPVHHRPAASRATAWRRRRDVRNTLWFLWLRRPAGAALRRSVTTIRASELRTSIPALVDALRGLPWVLRERDVAPPRVERSLRRLDAGEQVAHVERPVERG